MGVPVDFDPILFATSVNGLAVGLVVPIGRRAEVKRLRVVQLSGDLDGFTFSCYSRYEALRAAILAARDAGPSSSGSDAGPDDGLPDPPAYVGYDRANDVSLDPGWDDSQAPLYLLCPPRTVAAAAASDDPAGFDPGVAMGSNDYACVDGSRMRSTGQRSYLYLMLTPGGTGDADKAFGLDIGLS